MTQNPFSFKIAATVLVMVVGLAGAYLILNSSAPASDSRMTENIAEKSSPENPLLVENPIKWAEKTISGFNEFIISDKTDKTEKISLPENIDFENINLTEFVAKSSFTQMKNLDQSGKDPFDINDPTNKEFIEKAIAGIGSPASILNVKINENELKISNDNSFEAKSRYLNNLADIIVKDDPLKKVGEMVGSFNFVKFKEVADGYQRIVGESLNIAVPSEWLEYHKRFISVLKKQETIYRSIANFQADPVKAGLFAQLAEEIIKEETAIRKEFFENYLGLR